MNQRVYTAARGLLGRLEEAKKLAAIEQKCLRKSVGCAVLKMLRNGHNIAVAYGRNGPSGQEFDSTIVCSNVQGNCGCAHSEPRAIMRALRLGEPTPHPFVMVCQYSPCSYCANVVVDSELIRLFVFETLTEHDKRGLDIIRRSMPVIHTSHLQSELSEEVCHLLTEVCNDD